MSDQKTDATAQDTTKADATATVTDTKATDTIKATDATKTDAVKKEDVKPTAPANKPTEQNKVVPEKYDLKLPEGSLLDVAHVDKVSALAKERKLTNEEAQAVIDSDNANIAAYADGQKAKLKERQDAWVTESKTDKEYGGEAFPQNAELAKRVVERYGSDDLKKALNETGLGNHPELVRLFVRIGKQMSEDQLVLPKSESGAGKRAIEDIFYPTKEK